MTTTPTAVRRSIKRLQTMMDLVEHDPHLNWMHMLFTKELLALELRYGPEFLRKRERRNANRINQDQP